MAGGQFTVKAGLVLVTGGVGIGLSAAIKRRGCQRHVARKDGGTGDRRSARHPDFAAVPEEIINRLVENRNYTPADLLIMSRALMQIGAQNSAVYLGRGGGRATRGTAYFHRRRAELLAARGAELGGLAAFVPVVGHALKITRAGRAVAVFPLDDLAWTELPRRTFQRGQRRVAPQQPGAWRGVRDDRSGDARGGSRDQKARLENRAAQTDVRRSLVTTGLKRPEAAAGT